MFWKLEKKGREGDGEGGGGVRGGDMVCTV